MLYTLECVCELSAPMIFLMALHSPSKPPSLGRWLSVPLLPTSLRYAPCHLRFCIAFHLSECSGFSPLAAIVKLLRYNERNIIPDKYYPKLSCIQIPFCSLPWYTPWKIQQLGIPVILCPLCWEGSQLQASSFQPLLPWTTPWSVFLSQGQGHLLQKAHPAPKHASPNAIYKRKEKKNQVFFSSFFKSCSFLEPTTGIWNIAGM